MEREVRQTIIIRTKFPGGKRMRRGKEIAQGSHSSMAFLARRLRDFGSIKLEELSDEVNQWINGSFTKVCLKVDTEQEIKDIYKSATELGLECHMIVDSGKTEFGGKSTITSVCIGPNYKEDIDKITKHLKLY